MEGMKFRKSLLGISNQLSRQDLELLKFLCENDVPRARMERVMSGTDLFNALEERGKLSVKNLGFLVEALKSIGRMKLVETYLRNEGFVITPSSLAFTGAGPGAPVSNQTLQYLFRECLVKVAQGLVSTEVNSLVYVYQPKLQVSPDTVFSATQLFTLLQQRQIVTTKDMRLLYDGLCQVHRYDLAALVNEYMVRTGQRGYQGEQQGMVTGHQGRTGYRNDQPVQETTPAMYQGDPTNGMLLGYLPPDQNYGGQALSRPPHPPPPGAGGYYPSQDIRRTSSSGSSLSSDANASVSTPPSSTTTTDYPPHQQVAPPQGGGGVMMEYQPLLRSEPEQKMQSGWYTAPPQQPPPPQRNFSGEIRPFGLAFDVFETSKSAESASPPGSTREHEQQRVLEELAMKQGQLVRKEEEIENLRAKLEEANSDKSKVYSEKLGEAEQFKQSIRELEKMLRTKNEEVVSLSYELQHFHMQMEAMQAGRQIDEKEFYRMDKNPHGICVIINNHKFHHPTDPEKAHNDRGGAEVDQKNLQLTFQYLRYKVEVYENLTHTQMTELMLNMAQRNHAHYDSFICCILTHGEQNSVHGADSIPVSLFDLTGVMKMCTSLINKPKMFFIQACRGDLEDKGHKLEEVQRDSGGPKQPSIAHTIPQEADFFFGYATPLGNAAYRSRRHGSWYISELCKVMTMQGYTSNLGNMMRKVNDNICKAFTKEGYKQTSEFVDRLRKEVHFFHFSKVQQKAVQ